LNGIQIYPGAELCIESRSHDVGHGHADHRLSKAFFIAVTEAGVRDPAGPVHSERLPSS
jgi:hypothetical protein